jgi:hypothetical protein
MQGVANRPSIVAVLGATGSGKSTFVKRELLVPAPRRLLVWDFSPVSEYAAFGKEVNRAQFAAAVDAAGAHGNLAVVLKPSATRKIRALEFDLFCQAALAYGNYTVLVEEVGFVTEASYAPDWWRQCVLTGRKLGLRIIGTSQRPAQVDKHFLSNCTLIRTGCIGFGYDEDIRTVARTLKLPEEEIARLQPLDWIQLDRDTRTYTRGRLTF